MRPLGPRQREALAAVQAGQIHHVHPFTWALPLEMIEAMPYARWFHTLNSLANRHLIRVEATSKEYVRPVHITPEGAALLNSPSPGPVSRE